MSTTTNLASMEDSLEIYDVPAEYPLPFVNKPRHETQPAPPNWFRATHPFVLDWHRETDKWAVQCAFCLGGGYANNHYTIFVRDYVTNRLYRLITRSLTVYPPVWDRGFGGPDYHDYLKTQSIVKRIMDDHNMTGFEVDETPEGKFVHMTKETPDEVRDILARGGSYSIVALRAEVGRDKLVLKSVTPIS